jgi:hypothetical protein
MEPNLAVDRLTIVGNKIEYKLQKVIAGSLLVDGRYRAQYPYDWRYELVGGGVMEIGSLKDQSDIRLDFNPNSVKTEEHKNMIKDLISTMKNVRITRVDPALDLKGIDINDYAIIDSLSRKYNSWHSGTGRLETYYIGATTSDLRIRIYDKALEQGEKGDWWRIESQLRREYAENYSLFNPFVNLTLVRKDVDLSHIKTFKEKVFIKHLLENQNDLFRLAKNTRTKYKKILQDLAGSDSTEVDFIGIYEGYKGIIDATIREYTQVSETNNVI